MHGSRKNIVTRSFAFMAMLLPPINAELQAQHPVVEASATARAAWQNVRTAFASGDLDAAAIAIETATSAWPTQVVYQRISGMIAARRDDTRGLKAALDALIALESGARLADDEAVAGLRSDTEIDEAVFALLEATAPVAQSRVWRTIADSVFYAEGIDADPRTGSVYVASIWHRTVIEIDANGTIRDLNLSRHSRMGAALGVRVDPGGQSLWVTTSGLARSEGYVADDNSIAALLRISIADGSIEGRWDLPDDGEEHILGDLAIGPDGDVFVTDSDYPQLLRLRPGAEAFESITHVLFRSLQGVAPHPNGRFVYAADFSHGILRIDLETENVIRLPDAPNKTSLGVDGIAWHRGSIIGVQNGVAPPQITRFVLNDNGTMITASETIDRNVPIADEPTIGTLLGNSFIYVANSQWEKYDDEGNRREGTKLSATVLLRLEIDW